MERMTDRLAIVAALDELATLLELSGGNPYRARAYAKAARAIEGVADLERLAEEDRLKEIPGVGPSIAAAVQELRRTGTTTQLDELRADFGPGAAALARIDGLSPEKIRLLHASLGIASVEDLRAACEAGRVRTVRGFGPKTEEKLLAAIALWETRQERLLLVDARALAARLEAHLRTCPAIATVDVVGSIRRWVETAGGVDLLATARGGDEGRREALAHFAKFPAAARADVREDEGQATLRIGDGARAVLWVVPPEARAYHLVALTGSRAHVEKIGLPGRHDLRGARSEAEIYEALGLPFVPPELREDEGEIEAARAGDRFADLLAIDDVRGIVHAHTTYSDGKASVAQMARAAQALGMEYLTITDHSPTAFYAGGVEPARLADQWAEIARAEEELGITLLRGTESDIRQDGALDYPDEVLARLEIVIASIHARHKMNEAEMTERLVRAMRAPVFKIWGHALGRLVMRRPPIACDVEAVLDAAAAGPVAIELNGDPYRLDMEPRWARRARARGLRFVVSTDAHSTSDLENLPYAVALARRSGIRRGEVLNTLPAAAFKEAVRPVR